MQQSQLPSIEEAALLAEDLACIGLHKVSVITSSAEHICQPVSKVPVACQSMASGLLGHLRCLQTKPAFCSFTTRQPLPARRQHSCAALPGDDFESTSDDVQSLPVAENSGRVSPDGNRTEALIKSLQGVPAASSSSRKGLQKGCIVLDKPQTLLTCE